VANLSGSSENIITNNTTPRRTVFRNTGRTHLVASTVHRDRSRHQREKQEGIMKRFTAAILGVTAMTCLAAPSWAQQLRAAGQDVPPWIMHNKGSDALSGVAVELVDAIAKDAGLQPQYQAMVFADLIPAVSSGKIDLIATNMAITPERAEKVDFSNTIHNPPSETVVVQASDMTAYKSLADLKGLPVGAQKGSIQLALLQRTGGFSEIKIYPTEKDAWDAVAAGQVKAAVTPGGDTIYSAKQGLLTNLRIVSTYVSPNPRPRMGFAVQKGNGQLLGKVNSALARLQANGTVKAIFIKYGVDDWAPPK
jgi:polar amino acid transport system substrate-binding protein